ncbi:MAG: site-2 protease family protein [Cyanobacteriota bacterium]
MDRFFDATILYLVFLMSTTFHEAAHAAVALWGGDRTAYLGGQVSLDPMPHIRREPMGMVLVPLILLFTTGGLMGWASAPYNVLWARHNHRKAALMSFAGPAANLLLFISAGLLMKIGISSGFFISSDVTGYTEIGSATSLGFLKILKPVFSLNLILFALNLMPLPGLDGSGVVCGFFDKNTAWKISDFISNPSLSFVSFILILYLFPTILRPLEKIASAIFSF